MKSRGTTRVPAVVPETLGVDLSSRKGKELFRWFLACLLFGRPIQQEIAERAYFRLVSAGLSSPDRVLDAGWDELVRLLDEAHYVRYDFFTQFELRRASPDSARAVCAGVESSPFRRLPACYLSSPACPKLQ